MLKYIVNVSICGLILCGCDNLDTSNKFDQSLPENEILQVTETRDVTFFECSKDFSLPSKEIIKLNQLLKTSRAAGKTNIAFRLISGHHIPRTTQMRVKEQIYSIMRKQGFIDSRIRYMAPCIYKGAIPSLRIDILNYDVNDIDCSKWRESIGDIDTKKSLPKYGYAGAYNLNEMIVNKADLMDPKEYKGMPALEAVYLMSKESSSGGDSSGSSSSSSSSSGLSSSSSSSNS